MEKETSLEEARYRAIGRAKTARERDIGEKPAEDTCERCEQLQAENKRLGNEIFRYNDELSDSLTKIKQLQAHNETLKDRQRNAEIGLAEVSALNEQLQAENKELTTLRKMCAAIVVHNLPLPAGRERYYVRGDMFIRIKDTLEALKEK